MEIILVFLVSVCLSAFVLSIMLNDDKPSHRSKRKASAQEGESELPHRHDPGHFSSARSAGVR